MKVFVCFCVLMLAKATLAEVQDLKENPSPSDELQSSAPEPNPLEESTLSPEVEEDEYDTNSTDTSDNIDEKHIHIPHKLLKPIKKKIHKLTHLLWHKKKHHHSFRNGTEEAESVVPTNTTEAQIEAQIEAQTEANEPQPVPLK